MFPLIYFCKYCGKPGELVADPFMLAVWRFVEMMPLCDSCQVYRFECS